MGNQKNVRYGRQSIVRSEWPAKPVGLKEVTVQRLLATEHAVGWLTGYLKHVFVPDLRKLGKRSKGVDVMVKELQKELREYNKTSVDDSIGCLSRVTVIPKAAIGEEAA